jgi:hypothetical protein
MVPLCATNCIELPQTETSGDRIPIDVGNVKMQSAVLWKKGQGDPHIGGQAIQVYIASRRIIPASNLL